VEFTVERSQSLQQRLLDFVMDAEGELAVALERFSADNSARAQQQGLHQRQLVINRFLVEGRVDNRSPIDLFIAQATDLSSGDRVLLQQWQRAFIGLFELIEYSSDQLVLMNWTTAKRYSIQLTKDERSQAARLKPGEILLTQIAPLTEHIWMVFSPWTMLGKLGKPKLAVAIGNFKQAYKSHLYSDAPELLAEAWRSVAQYHQYFLDFFESDEVTLSGHHLGKKLAAFQTYISQQQLEKSGIDPSRSLAELADETGTSQTELAEVAEALGADAQAVDQLLSQKPAATMAAPQVELPPHLKQAETVTALSHPHWGQLFLPTYAAFQALLERDDEGIRQSQSQRKSNSDSHPQSKPQSKSQPELQPGARDRLIRQFLENPETNWFVWHRLAERYPTQLERLLQDFLQRPFELRRDLDGLLQEFGKPSTPELPEIASVPLHLHTLFQDAVLEVSKEKSKAKGKKPKAAIGFQRG
jgi:hypothetical protein